MRKLFYPIVFCYGLCCLGGCENSGRTGMTGEDPVNHILDFDKAMESPGEINLSAYVSALTFIPLETNDSLLLSAEYIGFEINDRYIFIYDMDALHRPVLFDRKGRFERYIGQLGHGPGEFTEDDLWELNNVYVDNQEGSITFNIKSWRRIYSFDGSFLKQVDMLDNLRNAADSSLRNRFFANGIEMVSSGKNMMASRGAQALFTSEDGGENFRSLGNCSNTVFMTTDGEYSGYSVPWNIFVDHVAIFDYNDGSYNRFFYNGHHKKPYIFKFGEGFRRMNGKTVVNRLLETSGFLLVSINRNRFIYDKRKDRLTFLKLQKDVRGDAICSREYFINDVEPGFSFDIVGVTRQGALYAVMRADIFRKQAFVCENPTLQKMAAEMSDDDNQVLVIAEMK